MFPNWEPHNIIVNGASFNYYRTPQTKDAGKPSLILQHGFSDNGLCWTPVAQELGGEYDIIMPDARGHGLSARVVRGEGIDQAADLADLMGALGVTQAVFAGHSMGANIVSDLAARFPNLACAMFLEDPPWFTPRPEEPQNPYRSMEESPLGQWMTSLKDKSLEQIMAECRQEHPNWIEPYVRAWCQGKKELDLNFLASENRSGKWQDRLPEIKCPVLVITAEPNLGGLVTPETAALAMGLNANLRVVNFPGVGHHVRFALHETYMQTFKAFLDQVA